jgi:hypothetical protein
MPSSLLPEMHKMSVLVSLDLVLRQQTTLGEICNSRSTLEAFSDEVSTTCYNAAF